MTVEEEAWKLLASRFSNHLLKHMQTCEKCKFNWYEIFSHMMSEEMGFRKDFMDILGDHD